MRRAVAALALALSAVLVVGGVAVAAAPAKAERMSAKQLRRAANRICTKGNEKLEAIAERYFPSGEQEQRDAATLQAYVGEVEPVVTDQIESLGALRPPKKLAKRVQALLRTARDDLADLLQDPTILLESNPFADTKTAAEKLGFEVCAA